MKKLLYICNRIFWPPRGGHEVEMFNYCKGLNEVYHYNIDVFIFSDVKTSSLDKPEFLNNIFYANDINAITKFKNLLHESFLKRKWPIQCSLYYSNENANKIRKISSDGEYDVVIFDMIRLAPYFKSIVDLKCKKILDIDDTLSKRYIRQLKSLDSKTNIAGQYSKNLPVLFQKLLQSTWLKKMILKFEIPRMKWAEKHYSELFDYVIFVSSIETDAFNKKYNTNKAVTVGMGVDYDYYSQPIEAKKKKNTASFVGNMMTSANADSVRMIVTKILPKSKKLDKVFFIGAVDNSLREEFQNNKRVQFTGPVDDLREVVKQTNIFLAPLSYGTGIKTKILEAMAMGMPVITNSIGAEGIPGQNGKHWFVSDDYAELGKLVDELLSNYEQMEALGINAQKFVEKDFQWNIIYKQFERCGL